VEGSTLAGGRHGVAANGWHIKQGMLSILEEGWGNLGDGICAGSGSQHGRCAVALRRQESRTRPLSAAEIYSASLEELLATSLQANIRKRAHRMCARRASRGMGSRKITRTHARRRAALASCDTASRTPRGDSQKIKRVLLRTACLPA